MNPGGEPERDDTGLPPVDIEIPDDARELDRDVQAYFRELRAERRRQRRGRWHGSLARDGIVLPLLACCLILALITGTLLTVFSATSDQNLIAPPGSGTTTNRPSSPPAATSPPASSSTSAAAGQAGAAPGQGLKMAAVPDVGLMIGHQQIFLHSMSRSMLVLIPPRCECSTAVRSLTRIGATAGAGAVLVGTQGTIGEALRFQSRLDPLIARRVQVAVDGQGVLQRVVRAIGLTAVVTSGATTQGGRESVAYARNLTASELTAGKAPLSKALSKALGG